MDVWGIGKKKKKKKKKPLLTSKKGASLTQKTEEI
jgi:hypothetical protein